MRGSLLRIAERQPVPAHENLLGDKRSAGMRLTLKIDLATFYASIYTHGIPWVIHGKQVARSKRAKDWCGNRLDVWMRDTRDRQTKGIPAVSAHLPVIYPLSGLAEDAVDLFLGRGAYLMSGMVVEAFLQDRSILAAVATFTGLSSIPPLSQGTSAHGRCARILAIGLLLEDVAGAFPRNPVRKGLLRGIQPVGFNVPL